MMRSLICSMPATKLASLGPNINATPCRPSSPPLNIMRQSSCITSSPQPFSLVSAKASMSNFLTLITSTNFSSLSLAVATLIVVILKDIWCFRRFACCSLGFPFVNVLVRPNPEILRTPLLFKGCRGLGAICSRSTMRFLSICFYCQWVASPILTTLPIYPGLGPALSSAGLLPGCWVYRAQFKLYLCTHLHCISIPIFSFLGKINDYQIIHILYLSRLAYFIIDHYLIIDFSNFILFL